MKSIKKKKWYFIAGGVLLVIIIVLAVNKRNNKDQQKISTESAAFRTLVETVSANGKIQPETDIKISPYISGEVIELLVKEGGMVKNGDLLAKIDPEIYQSAYDQSAAQVNSQKANLANSRAQLAQVDARFRNSETVYKRNKSLWEQKVISEADFETARTNFEVAKADLEAAKQSVKSSEFSISSSEAGLKKAREDLTKTAVFAPADGKVSKLSVEKGERVTGASQFSSGTELMRIANLNSMMAVVEVNENDIIRVKVGDTALIEVDAYLNRKFKGLVTEIATSATTQGVSLDQVTNFEVKIHILKESYVDLIPVASPDYSPFRPGMSTTVDIRTKIEKDVLSIPLQAVTTRTDTTGRKTIKRKKKDESEDESKKTESNILDFIEYVFVYKDGSVKLKEVKSGIQDNTYIQILSGLEKDEEVVVAPFSAVSKGLKNGDKVEKVDKEKLFSKEKE
ncbi:MAG: efflux RND transporter periplasmic adaptor subunit [Bacteroidales bacterium]|jgi:HlyD family secretion protein|nr:efflux RND transporter periplasmic adaptor subunit [Bacteroidales bacterium]